MKRLLNRKTSVVRLAFFALLSLTYFAVYDQTFFGTSALGSSALSEDSQGSQNCKTAASSELLRAARPGVSFQKFSKKLRSSLFALLLHNGRFGIRDGNERSRVRASYDRSLFYQGAFRNKAPPLFSPIRS